MRRYHQPIWAPTRAMRTAVLIVALALLAAAGSGEPAAATARTSLPTIERQVMCVTCKIPLNLAQSPQAERERAFIQTLIERGQSEAQIKRALVGQYGSAVLALPSSHGFGALAYLVPLAAVLMLVATLALLLPRWRRRARAQTGGRQTAEAISPAEAARLDADLARFD